MRTILSATMIFALLAGYAIVGQAQPVFSIDEPNHNMGKVYEKDGPKSHKYRFTNTGDKPLKINSVNPTCGCTTPDFTNKPVPPGGEGFIKAVYDPSGRRGKFDNSIRVHTNAGMHRLKLSGETVPKVKSHAETHPHQFGSLRSRTPNFFIGEYTNKQSTGGGSFTFINDSDERVRLLRGEGPSHIDFRNLPLTIEPGQEGTVDVHYRPKDQGDVGYVFDDVKIHSDDPRQKVKEFKISSKIMPDPGHYDDPSDGARLIFESEVVNLGYVMMGDKPEGKVKFTNTGKENLEIYRIQPSCGCTASKPDKSVISPGESGYITVSLDTKGRPGENLQSIRVFSNDAFNPQQRIEIKAHALTKE